MKNAIARALKDLDGLGERAVKTRILGIKDEADDDAPVDGEDGQKEGDNETLPDGDSTGLPETEPDGDEMDPELKKKLMDLLSQ